MKLLMATVLMFATTVAADPLRVFSIDEARKQLGEKPTETVKIVGQMTVTSASFYGCAFKDAKAWAAFTIEDRAGEKLVVYLKKKNGRSSLTLDDGRALLISATIKAPKQRGKCAIAQYELVKY